MGKMVVSRSSHMLPRWTGKDEVTRAGLEVLFACYNPPHHSQDFNVATQARETIEVHLDENSASGWSSGPSLCDRRVFPVHSK